MCTCCCWIFIGDILIWWVCNGTVPCTCKQANQISSKWNLISIVVGRLIIKLQWCTASLKGNRSSRPKVISPEMPNDVEVHRETKLIFVK